MPVIFHKLTKVAAIGITVCLVVLGCLAIPQLTLGLNQSTILVKDSDAYDYFGTLYLYSETGAPAYAVFNNIDYTDEANLETMNLIAAEMTTKWSNSVLGPVYSWVAPF